MVHERLIRLRLRIYGPTHVTNLPYSMPQIPVNVNYLCYHSDYYNCQYHPLVLSNKTIIGRKNNKEKIVFLYHVHTCPYANIVAL